MSPLNVFLFPPIKCDLFITQGENWALSARDMKDSGPFSGPRGGLNGFSNRGATQAPPGGKIFPLVHILATRRPKSLDSFAVN